MTKWTLLCVLLLASLSRVALACTCRPGLSLEEHYRRADHVLVAKISGCAPDRLSREGYCREHGWTFETVENLKGSDAQVRQQPPDARYIADTCDISLKVGQAYLLFLLDGRTYQCSGTGALSGESGARKQSELEILRAYREGKLKRIVNPWYFSDSGWYCGIDHLLEGGAELRLGYVHGTPPTSIQKTAGESPKPNPVMTLRLVEPFEINGPARLEIDGQAVALTRSTHRLGDSYTYTVDTVRGPAALVLLDRLMQPSEFVFSGKRSLAGSVPEPFRATTSSAFAADAAARFRDCVAAHPAPN